ncbi:cobyric acid synthase [Arenicella sp. 4NH20-0111]
MIQGCTSDAGKTVMVAGLCRLLRNKGLNVAPFKPQNMALNSAVTTDGGEIGRAQALQAIAAGVPARTDFNPVLLKPSSDTGSQVIIHGKAISDMQAQDYHDYKQVAMNAVIESFDRLTTQFSHVVVEGAGSPAEINLRAGDIANMGFAEEVDCPVIIIADIDRGGVFAHLVGTLDLLSKTEQRRVVGFIINKFRGDIALLNPGLEWLEERTGKPVLGVVPYLHNLFLDAEDAINIEQSHSENALSVVVPILPRISNHTDFDALRLHPNVNLKFVPVDSIDRSADLIVIPGSKNVISDLHALFDNGWQETLNRHLRYGGKVLGICGGYQMLGESIRDPLGIENAGISAQTVGFGLLNCKTELAPAKQLTNVSAVFDHAKFNSASVKGYEIHCGLTQIHDQSEALFTLTSTDKSGGKEGCVNQDGSVAGTYLHGLFDEPNACNAILNWAGLDQQNALNLDAIREQQLNRLADSLEHSLSKEFIEEFVIGL